MQFRQVFEPMLIAAAAALGLVGGPHHARAAAPPSSPRCWRSPCAAWSRSSSAPSSAAPINWFALYLGPALVIELLALTPLIKRPIVFGAVGGLGIATVGLWLESLWIDAVYDYPWPTSIWPEALAMAVPVAVLVGACGAMIGMVLTNQQLPRRAISVGLVVLAVLAIGGATANGLRYEVPQNATATIALTDAPSIGDQRMATADIRINPPDLVSADPNWVSVLGWQGGTGQPARHLRRQAGEARPRPLPLDEADAGVRASGRPCCACTTDGCSPPCRSTCRATRASAPRRCPPRRTMTRPFVGEITILQRERNPDTPQALWLVGCLVVLVCTLILIGGLSWGAGRLNKAEPTGREAELEPSAQA